MAQNQVFGGAGSTEDDEDFLEGTQKQVNVAQIDALLDQIDNVLASDAQTFVSGFVQKGGQ